MGSKEILLKTAALLFPWTFFAFAGLILIIAPAYGAIYFSILTSAMLFVFVGTESLKAGRGIYWALGALLASLVLSMIIWNRLETPERLAVCTHLIIAAATLHFAHLFYDRMVLNALSARQQIMETGVRLASKSRENDFYSARADLLRSQIGHRQRLSSYAREMGRLLDPSEVRETLIRKTQELFPYEKVTLKVAADPEDPVEFWVSVKKNSLLVRDLPNEARTLMNNQVKPRTEQSDVKSVLATPLLIERNLIGLIRVDSDESHRFSEADLQQLDVYAHFATLALENAQLFSKVNAMATKDGLTGLATHRIFQEKIADELMRASRYHKDVSLIMIDIDHFKSINDRYGHLVGDKALIEVAQILMSQCRNVDFPARYGGEEFALILPELNLARAQDFAEALRAQIEARAINVQGRILRLTVSIGCSTFPKDAQTSSQLIRKADERLYRAKSSGRNIVVAK